jgi:hypothetical protein
MKHYVVEFFEVLDNSIEIPFEVLKFSMHLMA